MTELILHHYPNSPFAEKIRLILGAKKQSWHSVTIPMIMPKPDLVALTGGYRRTPVMQIGADIYCDTALICDVLEHLAPTPALYPAAQKGMARVLAQGDTRPMSASTEAMQDLRRILSSRSPFYAKADLHFDTSLQPLEESFQTLKKAWLAQN